MVVFPWSMWAMMAMLRIFSGLNIDKLLIECDGGEF
jgi:hypothetical protein